MNRINIVKNKTRPLDDRTCELEISSELEPVFRQHFEIEMLQGERRDLPGGMVYFSFQLADDKAKRVVDCLTRFIIGVPENNN